MSLLAKGGRQGSTVRGESSYFDKPLNIKNENVRVYIDLRNSLDYGVSVASKGRKNEKEKHILLLRL